MLPRPIAPSAPFFIVINGGSGRHDADATRETIERVFKAERRPHTIHVVTDPSRLESIAKATVRQAQAQGGVVVAAGGDGTINTMAQATLGSGCTFGVLPKGTFNYFSRTHGIPADTEAALKVLLTGKAHPVQVGRLNDRIFLVNASLGLYPQLLEDREAFKQQYGRSRLVALWSSLATLMHNHRQLRLRIERGDQTTDLRTPTLFVGNNRLQLEQIGMAESDALDHGLLAAITPKPVGTLAMLWLMVRGALGRLGDADNVQSFAFKRITVSANGRLSTRMKVATDGEVVTMRGPLEFSVADEHLMLLRPDDAELGGDPG